MWLFVSLIPSAVGFVLFVYGKKQERWPQMAAGLLLMVYPYFATSLLSLVATGAVIGFMCEGQGLTTLPVIKLRRTVPQCRESDEFRRLSPSMKYSSAGIVCGPQVSCERFASST